MIGRLIMTEGRKPTSLRSGEEKTQTTDDSSIVNLFNIIALEEFWKGQRKAIIKQEDDLSNQYTILRLYKEEDNISYLDRDYSLFVSNTSDTTGDMASDMFSDSDTYATSDARVVPNLTSSLVVCNIKGNIVEVNFWYNSKVFLGKPFKKHHKSPESYHSLETSTFNSIYCHNMGLVIEINPTQSYVYLLSLHYLIEHDVDRNQCLINNPCPHGSQLCSDRKPLKCEELYLYCYLCGHGWTSHESEITMT